MDFKVSIFASSIYLANLNKLYFILLIIVIDKNLSGLYEVGLNLNNAPP